MRATHYGESYEGRPMGCGGIYRGGDAGIAAVGPGRYGEWPCGTRLFVNGPIGSIVVTRTDSCPGCSGQFADLIDLSEAGHAAVCGPGGGTCRVTVTRID